MANFAQMKSYVSARLLDPNNTAISSATVGDAINDAINYWKFERFWFNTASGITTLVSDQVEIDLSSFTDFLVEELDGGLVIEYSAMRYVLQKQSPKNYDECYLSNGVGRPEIYTIKNGQYFAYFIPDQDYTLRVYYLKEYTPLINDGDTNDFTVNATRLINLWALANLFAELRQDSQMEAYYRAAALDEFKNLGVMNANVNATGQLTLHSYL